MAAWETKREKPNAEATKTERGRIRRFIFFNWLGGSMDDATLQLAMLDVPLKRKEELGCVCFI